MVDSDDIKLIFSLIFWLAVLVLSSSLLVGLLFGIVLGLGFAPLFIKGLVLMSCVGLCFLIGFIVAALVE